MADPISFEERSHADFGALQQRVLGTETGLRDLSTAFVALRSDLERQIGSLGSSLASQISDISKAFSDSSRPNLGAMATIGLGAVGILITIGTLALSPTSSNVDKLAATVSKSVDGLSSDIKALAEMSVRREDFRDFRASTNTWITHIRDQQESDEKASVTQRQIDDLKTANDERYRITVEWVKAQLARDESIVAAIDSQLVKRPEIEAANHAQDDKVAQMASALGQRIELLSTRANVMQTQLDQMFPPSKLIDELWNGLRELRVIAASGPAAQATK